MDFMSATNEFVYKARMKLDRKDQLKARIRSKVNALGDWVNRNAGTIVILTPAVVALTRTAMNAYSTVRHHAEMEEEQDRRDYTCYDRSEGHYWELSRKLNNSDWGYINARRADGEKLGDILKEIDALE